VTDKLVEHFPDIVNVNFTAEMEEDLDEIAEGDLQRVQVLRQFYTPFADALERAEEKFERYVEELDEDCPRCIEEGRHASRSPAEAPRAVRLLHRVHPVRRGGRRLQVHPQPRRPGTPRAGDARRELPRLRPPAAAQVRSLRTVRGLLRVPGLQVHQEGPAEVDRRHLSSVQAG
jgi:hypothetical protein